MPKRILAAGAVALWALAALPANAALITSQGALASNDSINWAQLGPTNTGLSGPQSVISSGGLTAIVTSAGGFFQRRDQGNGWAGNFTSGDALLWDSKIGPDITITFDTPVFGVGAQIMSDFIGSFVARILLSNGNTFTENGNSTFNGDGSAIFIGALDGTADISSISFTLDSAPQQPNDFVIDTLFLNTTGSVSSVPEPATLALFGAGLAGLGVLRRRRRRRRRRKAKA